MELLLLAFFLGTQRYCFSSGDEVGDDDNGNRSERDDLGEL